jgi:hypothetical protein
MAQAELTFDQYCNSTLLVFKDGHLASIHEVRLGRNSVEMYMVPRYMFTQG